MENKKQAIILSVIILITLVTLIVGATYAYFQATSNNGSNTNVNVTTYTSDLLTFEIGSDIAVYADQTSFASGKGNATGTTFAKAILIANNKTNTATKNYYMYLNISNNTFTYSIDENTPELLLTITDASGNEIKSITGLTHKTVTDGKGASISGFDITTKSGLLTLFDNREIIATPTKTDTWNVTVTFVNYNANQTGNAGKSFNAKLIIQKEKIKETVATVCSNGQTLSSCIIAMDGKDDTLYHHTSTLSNGAGDNSYRYAGANPNNFVCFGTNESPCPTDNLYRIIGVFGENYHGVTGKQLVKLIKYDFATSALLGTDGDYKGSDTPDSTKYKGSLTSIDTYYWNYKATGRATNTWSTSLLNKTNLNTNFINNIGTTWANKIATVIWKVGGVTFDNIYQSVSKTAYQYEVGSNASTTTVDKKIGLMYASDYGFGAVPKAWTRTLYSYDLYVNGVSIRSQNWMYMGNDEWTILRSSGTADFAFRVSKVGDVSNRNVTLSFGVRPSFNLESSVKYVSGSGSMSDPVRIN